ncbi:MAG: DNA metabolism protein [Coriobacteriaceae bacterium]|nr:DNA metabolism protein [Coriobacteriaceae bacterium]
MGELTSDHLLNDGRLTCLYDGSFEGLLSAIFWVFEHKENPVDIVIEENLQSGFDQVITTIDTDIKKAERVKAGIIRSLGYQAYKDVRCVFLSDDERKGRVMLRFLQYSLKRGARSRSDLAEPIIADFDALLRAVNREIHYQLQFIRFSELRNGIFFAKIHPKANVVPLIMSHFAARLNIQPFMIFDEKHALAGIYDCQRWWMVEAEAVSVPDQCARQDEYQALWQTFYDTIAIEERANLTCRRNFMPKRFWGDLCEMIPHELRKGQPQTATPTACARLAGEQSRKSLQSPLN